MTDESRADYVPEPIDTSRVRLSDDLLGLSQLLAKNTHEVWARQRLSDGWRYGPARDDVRREHPSLVPYEELSESEKAYDLNTVLETLKATVSLGYRIERAAGVARADGGREGDD
ncbi:MAG: RyR domain-containing protein [Pyrinomonadaceae bacterium]